MVRALVRFASAAIVAFLGVAQGYRPGDEICSYSSGSSCPLSAIKPSATDGSVLIYPGGKTRCAYDDFKDPATGFTSNATYFFQVFPKPQKKKLALMLQGGGACIDQITCSFSIQCSLPSSLVSTRAQAISTGIFNSNDATNPLKDWNIVHLPYCTGDLHVGNAVLPAYESGLESIFGRPQCLGQKKAMYLNGWENVKAAFTWAKANYPDVDELIIGGMSAGSLGAQALATYAADLWNVQAKGISFGVLADSYVGVLPADKPAGKILKFYGGCNSDLKLPASIVASCNAETTTISEIGQAVLKQLPNAALLFINSMGDGTQRLFYQLVKEGVFGYPFPNLMSEADYFVEVNKIIDLYKAVNKRVSSFFVPGTQHVFLNSNGFSAAVNQAGEQLGNALSSWIQSLGATTPTTAPTPTTSSPTPTRPAC